MTFANGFSAVQLHIHEAKKIWAIVMNVTLCLLLCAVLTFSGIQAAYKSGFCPLRNTVSNCTPRCYTDYECSSNEKCCPNKCNSMSCTSPSPVNTGNDDRYKRPSDRVMCAGVKCRAYEKCEFDRNTKRERCVRA